MRLLLVWRADPDGAYEWLPPRQPGETIVTFDDLAARDLESRGAVRFDDLQTWDDRSAGERLVSQAYEQISQGDGLGALAIDGYRLADFFEHSIRVDFAHVLRGWVAAGAAHDCTEVIADPTCAAALVIGALARAGLPFGTVAYQPAQPPTEQSDRSKRVASRVVVRAAAMVTRRHTVRIAATANYKVTPALATAGSDALRELGVATMPLPGFDSRENVRCAARWRVPLLPTLDPISTRGYSSLAPGAPDVQTGSDSLDAGLRHVAASLGSIAWLQLAQAVRATRGLDTLKDLRALLLPTLFSGTPRVFTAWAQRHDVSVAVLQHGVYAYRAFNGQDRGADVVLTWGDAAAEQARAWSAPTTSIVTVGAPGVVPRTPRRPGRVTRVMLATTGLSHESALAPTALHDWYLDAVLPGAAWLQERGVEVELRLHPSETTERYARAMARLGVRVPFGKRIPFPEAIAGSDILVSSFSSVALEAAALGVPVLMWQPPMPEDFRTEHLLPPWTRMLPGVFHGAAEFMQHAEGMLGSAPPAVALGRELSSLLASYAEPFRPDAFLDALGRLAS